MATHQFGDHTDVGSLNAASDVSGQTRGLQCGSKQLAVSEDDLWGGESFENTVLQNSVEKME